MILPYIPISPRPHTYHYYHGYQETEINSDLDEYALCYIIKLFTKLGIKISSSRANNCVFAQTEKLIVVLGSNVLFSTVNSYPTEEIPFMSARKWANFPRKPDAFILFNKDTKHFIVLGSSTSKSWKADGFNNETYYICNKQKWHNGSALIDKLLRM